jgi:hypothetical protein
MKFSDTDLRGLALPAYLIAIILILIPIVDTTLAVSPLQPASVGWRFGALGLGSQAIMTPLLGGFLAVVTAVVLGHRRALRALQVLALIVAVLFAAAIVLFLLDAIQMRTGIRSEAVRRFDSASLVALIKYVIGIAGTVILSWTAHRAIKRQRISEKSSEQTPLAFTSVPSS